MAKKQNTSGSSWAVPFVIAATALVALLGVTTKGYTDWTFGLGTQETPVSSEEPSTEEVPTTEELPGTSEELPGTSEETPSTEEQPVPNEQYTLMYEAEDLFTGPDSGSYKKSYSFASNNYCHNITQDSGSLSFNDFSIFGENKNITLEVALAVPSESVTIDDTFYIISERYYMDESIKIEFDNNTITPGTDEEKNELCPCEHCDKSLVFKKFYADIDLTQFSAEEDLYLSIEIDGSQLNSGMGAMISGGVYLDYIKIIGNNEFVVSSEEPEEMLLRNNEFSGFTYHEEALVLGDEPNDWL